MEPITLITAAIVAALKAGTSELGKKAVADAYEHLKSAIKHRFGDDSALPKALAELEQTPDSAGRKLVLQEAVEATQAHADPDILQAARVLLEQVQAQVGDKRVQQIITGDCNAQAEGGSSASVNVHLRDNNV